MIGEPQAPDRLETEVPLFADVIVPRHFAGPFTYLVPPPLRPVLRVGHLVFVPFGRSLVQGAVIALTAHHPSAVPLERLKAIRTLATAGRAVDILPPLLRLARAVAETYVAPWGQCLRLVLPPKSPTDSSRIILTKEGQRALAVNESASPAAVQLLKRLKRRPLGIRFSCLCDGKEPAQKDILTSILERGWAHVVPSRIATKTPALVDPHRNEPPPALESVGPYINEWQARIARALEDRQAARQLVQAAHTERLALLRMAAARTLELGRKVLVITGEAARAESLATALVYPAGATAVLHSMMPDQKRADIWERIRQNDVAVIVGTRAAVFLPLHPLGLIWIDRDEDSALKEPMEPRYHARDVAWMRALEEQALLVLSSAHLSLETCGLEAPERLLKAPRQPDRSPHIELVDLRHENRATLLSTRLQKAMQEAIARRAGVLLFLNRRAYAGALMCRDCGQVPRCTSCAVAFAFSRQKHQLFCHYCGTTRLIPDLCSDCGSARLQPVGEGTERVEEEVKRRFPAARVLRIDGETMRRPKEAVDMWTRIRRREWDVLVGTQVLLRDDALPSVGVVAAVQADAGLSLPDFRAAERTFYLLQDAAALAQPMSAGGRCIIQSYLPTHHVIQAVARQEEAVFTSEELKHRTALGFPPAVRLSVLHISGALEATVEEAAQAWAAALGRAAEAAHACGDLTILGPVRSPVPRVRGRYRRQILIKSRPGFHAIGAIRSTLTDLESAYARRKVKFDVDVDPLDMW